MTVESLLHDPATYSTYPIKWHTLLQHLSLSHTLIVLHLRNLPASCFSNSAPLPFDDDLLSSAPQLPFSASLASMSSSNLPRSRMSSAAGSDAGSIAPASTMPRQERLVEISMPEPLAAQSMEEVIHGSPQTNTSGNQSLRRGSIGSIASAASLSFARKRSSSNATGANIRADMATSVTGPAAQHAAPMMSGKASLPPVSYPNPKRYGFTRHGDANVAKRSSESRRPGSVFSIQSSPAMSHHGRAASSYGGRLSLGIDRNGFPVPTLPSGLSISSPTAGNHRASFASREAAKSSRRSDFGGSSPLQPRWASPYTSRRDLATPPSRVEPAFERPPPYVSGRAPILRVFVPLSEHQPTWPSAEGAKLLVQQLDKCGATRRLKLGDLVVCPGSFSEMVGLLRSDEHRCSITKDYRARPGVRTLLEISSCPLAVHTLPDRSPAILRRRVRSASFLLLSLPTASADHLS